MGGWRPGGGTGLKQCSFITHLVDVQEVEEGDLDGQGAVEELWVPGGIGVGKSITCELYGKASKLAS